MYGARPMLPITKKWMREERHNTRPKQHTVSSHSAFTQQTTTTMIVEPHDTHTRFTDTKTTSHTYAGAHRHCQTYGLCLLFIHIRKIGISGTVDHYQRTTVGCVCECVWWRGFCANSGVFVCFRDERIEFHSIDEMKKFALFFIEPNSSFSLFCFWLSLAILWVTFDTWWYVLSMFDVWLFGLCCMRYARMRHYCLVLSVFVSWIFLFIFLILFSRFFVLNFVSSHTSRQRIHHNIHDECTGTTNKIDSDQTQFEYTLDWAIDESKEIGIDYQS